MEINLDTEILNLRGESIKTTEDDKEKSLTLSHVCSNALMTDVPQPQGQKLISGIEKLKKYELAKKVYSGGKVELTAEEITLIKEVIGKVYTTLIVGSAYASLENVKK